MGKYARGLRQLENWFQRQKRVLPWRDQPSLYRVWISEIMLQQTQVATVIPYFERFIGLFPTVETLAHAPEDEVLKAWAGLGYYSRARNLHRAAKQIVESGFPETREGWLEIPGVGDYTAGAVLSIALNQPEAILDGNVERVLSRLRKVGRERGDAAFKRRLWRLARAFVETAHHRLGIAPSVLNQGLMELGATVCTPRNPSCVECPLVDLCRAARDQAQGLYPPRKKPKEWLAVQEAMIAYFDSRGRLLVRKREKGEWRAGLWDLPEEDALTALPGGIGKQLVESELLGEIDSRHIVTRHKITRKTAVRSCASSWMASDSSVGTSSDQEQRWRWIFPDDSDVAIGSALKRTLEQIRERFPEVLRGS